MPEVIGIYEDPPPADAAGVIRSQRVARIGAVPLVEGFTRQRDRLFDAAEELLEELG